MQAAAELDRETKREAGDNQHGGHGGPPLPSGVTKAEAGTRDGIRRRLEKYVQEADPVWSQAQLQEAVKGRPGRPKKAEEKAPHRGAISSPATSDANRHPTDRKSRLIRTLTNLKQNPEACKEKGTTTKRAISW